MHLNFRVFIAVFFIAIMLFTTGCEEKTVRALPGSSGKAGEVVLVMENKYWNGKLGNFIKNSLAQEYKALPQPEPIFNIVHIPTSSFKGLFLTHRNILIFAIGGDKPTLISQKKNKWATSQVVVTVSAPSEYKCLELLQNKPSELEDIFTIAERNRLRQKFLSIRNESLGSKLKAEFGISLAVPSDYVIAETAENFIWFRKETPQISQGIFVYSYERGDNALDDLNMRLAMRDTISKYHIPGPLEGSYMSTMRDYPTSDIVLDFKGTEVIETRGLWKVVGDFMGGPFISFSLLSPDQSRIICIDGYVYAPKYNKRNYLRQVEAILYSLQIGK